MEALERGWIPKGPLNINPHVATACIREDTGEYHCILKPGQLDITVAGALGYIYNVEGINDTDEAKAALNLTGPELHRVANKAISDFYDKYHAEGATCDFGGIALLVEQNRTIEGDELAQFTDDDFFGYINEGEEGPPMLLLVVGGVAIAIFAGMVGFIIAMRTNPGFNRRVRSSQMLQPLVTVSSKSDLIRSSLNLPMLQDYETLQEVDRQHRQS